VCLHNSDEEPFGPRYVNVLNEEHKRPEVRTDSNMSHMKFSSNPIRLRILRPVGPNPQSSIVRCVYNYEDKYRFSRILNSDSLVFDSHFESGNLK
jgi:hypothetical protein